MDKLNIVPYPQEVVFNGNSVSLSKLHLNGENCSAVDFFVKIAKDVAVDDGGVNVNFGIDENLDICAEGYGMTIAKEGVDITAKDNRGLVHAFVTLAHLIATYKEDVPCVSIKDFPKIPYRGLLLDVGRYFYPVEDVKRIVELCALHKLNVLHFHITEDQGWRIVIDKYPLLTEIGSKRKNTNNNGKPHGGFYTKAEIAEIIKYSNSLGIEVIPEVDVPGHTTSVLACYPQYGCFGRKLDVATHFGIKHDVLCAGKEEVYQFVFDVFDEIIDLFGANTRYIHIGGDEVHKHRWSHCEDCQRKMKEENLATVEDLQRYFMRRVADYILAKGYTPVMWDEGISRVADDRVIYEYWGNEFFDKKNTFAKACEASRNVINATSGHCYMDFPFSYTSLRRAYQYEPTLPGREFAAGEIALWSEYVPDFKTACKRLIPRSSALCECLWSSKDKDYDEFEKRAVSAMEYLAGLGFVGVPLKVANPNPLRKLLQTIWFERRQLYWQGLKNIIDDRNVTKKYGKKNK